MTPFKIISITIIVAFIAGYLLMPNPKIEPVDPNQLPWHINIDEQQNSTVFGLTLGQSSFQDAVNVFGEGDKMALYADSQKPTIEIYFAYVEKAGLTARVIITLALSPQQADVFLSQAKSRMQSNSQIPKIDINPTDRHKTLNLPISSITYMPKYSGLDKDYLISRFGQPSHQATLSETATQLFYKTLGLSVISDTEGKEVFQYAQPSQLVIPDTATPYE